MSVRTSCPALLMACVAWVCGCASEEFKPMAAVSNLQRVTFREAVELQPSVSPDGRKLAFVGKLRAGGLGAPFQVWVLDTADQRKLVQVTQHTADSLRPSWSADQKTLLFDSKRLNTRTIWEKSSTGLGGEQQITADRMGNDWDAHVSPDGKILFIHEPEDLGYTILKILTLGLYDGRKVIVTDEEGKRLAKVQGSSANWSPDGERVVYATRRGSFLNNHDIWVMNADGSKRQRLTSHPAHDVDPSWSPDGSKIVFASDRAKGLFGGDDYDLWVMDANGSGLTQVTWGGRHEGHPSWGTDGYIYFHTNSSSSTRQNLDIWRVKPLLGRIIPKGTIPGEVVGKDLTDEIRDLEFDLQKKDTGPLRNVKPITNK